MSKSSSDEIRCSDAEGPHRDDESDRSDDGNVPLEITIRWTEHVITRVGQRFGFDDTVIPNRTIQKVGSQTEIGKKFRIRRADVEYVCQRQENGIVIITVLYAKTVEGTDR